MAARYTTSGLGRLHCSGQVPPEQFHCCLAGPLHLEWWPSHQSSDNKQFNRYVLSWEVGSTGLAPPVKADCCTLAGPLHLGAEPGQQGAPAGAAASAGRRGLACRPGVPAGALWAANAAWAAQARSPTSPALHHAPYQSKNMNQSQPQTLILPFIRMTISHTFAVQCSHPAPPRPSHPAPQHPAAMQFCETKGCCLCRAGRELDGRPCHLWSYMWSAGPGLDSKQHT